MRQGQKPGEASSDTDTKSCSVAFAVDPGSKLLRAGDRKPPNGGYDGPLVIETTIDGAKTLYHLTPLGDRKLDFTELAMQHAEKGASAPKSK